MLELSIEPMSCTPVTPGTEERSVSQLGTSPCEFPPPPSERGTGAADAAEPDATGATAVTAGTLALSEVNETSLGRASASWAIAVGQLKRCCAIVATS